MSSLRTKIRFSTIVATLAVSAFILVMIDVGPSPSYELQVNGPVAIPVTILNQAAGQAGGVLTTKSQALAAAPTVSRSPFGTAVPTTADSAGSNSGRFVLTIEHGGGLDIIVQNGGARLGCAVEVFSCGEPTWPWPVDRPGENPVIAASGETIDWRQGVAIAPLHRYVGADGHCFVPVDGRVSVSLAVLARGFDIQTVDRVALAPAGDDPKTLTVELGSGNSPAVAGRVVDELGRAVTWAKVIWSSRQPSAPWRVNIPTGPLPRWGGDQLRAFLEVASPVREDGVFELSPVLPSAAGVVRVFLGDVLAATRLQVCTEMGRTLQLEPIVVPHCRLLAIRLVIADQRVGGFRAMVNGGITTPEMNFAFGNASYAHSDHNGEVHAPVRINAPITIRLFLNTQDGRLALREQRNEHFLELLSAAQTLIDQVLEAHALRLEVSDALASDVTIRITSAQLREALGNPACAAALDGLSRTMDKSTAVPRDLLAAARAAANRKDLLPLFRQFLEPLN